MIIQTLQGDCREVLKSLPADSVNCVVTSPPYYGLRDYSTGTWEGGDSDCNHEKTINIETQIQTSTLGGGKKTTGHQQEGFKTRCGRCGANRIDQQIGLEETPAEYVAALVEVFREVKRVLRADGTCWLNLGDSYAANRAYQVIDNKHIDVGNNLPMRVPQGLKPKDLIGIPWRVAFALQEDGWYLRSDIIWAKPNPMPESVTDRPTKSHEYIFLLTKSAKYFYDAAAIAEPAIKTDVRETTFKRDNTKNNLLTIPGHDNVSHRPDREDTEPTGLRNKRTVWTVALQPFSGSHFATFPEKLIEPCILAGCPAGGTVLDPFAGSGTTLRVALKHSRNAIGIELNQDYHSLIDQRTDKVQVKMAI